MITLSNRNKTKAEQTGTPCKYPQGFFNKKPCRNCAEVFEPKAPSELYCTDLCKDIGITNAYLKRNYKIDYNFYLKLLEVQEELCAICKEPGFCMTGHHKMKLVVDHCHTTGQVRGLLCHNCNRALGLLKDNVNRLEKAIDYLKVQRLS